VAYSVHVDSITQRNKQTSNDEKDARTSVTRVSGELRRTSTVVV